MKLFYEQANEALHLSWPALLTFFLCFNNVIHAQTAPPIQWQKSLGGSSDDYAYSIQQTTEGGFIVAGSSYSNDSDVSGHHGDSFNSDYWIVKLDKNGNIAWQKSLGGSGDDDAASIQQTTDNGFIVAGWSASNDGNVSGHHGDVDYYNDYWIVKLDKNGNIVWQKSLGGSGDDKAYSVQQTTDGGFIVAGVSYSNDGDVSGNHGYDDYWVVKLDRDGNIVWQKSLGGSSSDWAYSIQQITGGGFIVVGYSVSNDGDVSGNHGYSDDWIVKLDANGNIVWQKSLGGSSYDGAASVQQITDGGFIVAGYSESNDGDVSGHHGYADYYNDYWIVKLDKNGNIVWQKSLGGYDHDFANSIQQTTDGGFIIAGSSYSNDGDVSGNHGDGDYWVVKLDANGNLVWQKCLGGSSGDGASSIHQTTDGGFIVAGVSVSNDGDVSGNHGSGDYWIVKSSAENQSCLSPSNLSVTNITATSAQLNWTIEGMPEFFLVTYHYQNGFTLYERVSGTTSSVTLSNLTPGTIYGWNVRANCYGLKSSPVFGEQFKTRSNKEEPVTNVIEPFSLYPNPSNGSFIINLQTGEETATSATIQILNALGQTIYNKDALIDNGVLQKEIHLIDAPSGMYLVKVTSSDRVYTSQINLKK